MMNPLISVVMPVYNAERYLSEAIDSILAQSYPNWELLLVDDGSRDASAEIARHYAARDCRIRFFANGRNLGVAKTRNRALAEARGIYVAPLDNDDVALPHRLAEQVRFLESHPDHALVGSDLEIIDENSRQIAVRTYPHADAELRCRLTRMNPVANPASMFRRSAYQELGGYDESVCPVEDYDFIVRLALRSKLANLPVRLTRYRVTSTQVKSVQLKKTLRLTLQIQHKALSLGMPDSFYNRIYRMALTALLPLPDRLVLWLFKQMAFSAETSQDKARITDVHSDTDSRLQ